MTVSSSVTMAVAAKAFSVLSISVIFHQGDSSRVEAVRLNPTIQTDTNAVGKD